MGYVLSIASYEKAFLEFSIWQLIAWRFVRRADFR
jgi:hypothetical protein